MGMGDFTIRLEQRYRSCRFFQKLPGAKTVARGDDCLQSPRGLNTLKFEAGNVVAAAEWGPISVSAASSEGMESPPFYQSSRPFGRNFLPSSPL